MTSGARYFIVIFFVLVSLGWAACTEDRQTCFTPKIASLNIHTIHFTSDTATVTADSSLPNAVFLALTADGPKGGYYPQQSSFTISLSSVADSCAWYIAPDTAATAQHDTVTFYYKRRLQFLSNACGYAYFYDIDSAHTTHNYIDSLQLLNRSVTNNVKTQHLQLYIHPAF